MPDSTEVPTMPPVERLLALDTLTLWGVVLTMVAWGATWRRSEGEEGSAVDKPRWILTGEGECFRSAWWDDDETFLGTLPNPLSNHASAWELMMREAQGWIPDGGGWHSFNFPTDDDTHARGPWHKNPNRALCLAVLHKHADGPLSHLITPLLEKIKEEGLDK
jgi:hypothetical protein